MKDIIDVLIGNCDHYKDINNFNHDYAKVSIYRKNKIDQCKYLDDKCLSLTAGILLKELLDKYDIDYHDLYYDHNKPLIKNNQAYISISHSGTYSAVVISNKDVSIDIQKHHKHDFNKIIKYYFNDDEKQQVGKSNNPESTFYEIWCKKECLIKCNKKDDMQFKLLYLNDYTCAIYGNKDLDVLVNIKK